MPAVPSLPDFGQWFAPCGQPRTRRPWSTRPDAGPDQAGRRGLRVGRGLDLSPDEGPPCRFGARHCGAVADHDRPEEWCSPSRPVGYLPDGSG